MYIKQKSFWSGIDIYLLKRLFKLSLVAPLYYSIEVKMWNNIVELG